VQLGFAAVGAEEIRRGCTPTALKEAQTGSAAPDRDPLPR